MKLKQTKTFTVGGISKSDGSVKVRFCSDFVLRIKNLQKQGDTDIKLIDLPRPMTKIEICEYLLTHNDFKKYEKDILMVLGKKTKKSQQVYNLPKQSTVDKEVEDIKSLITA